MQVPTKKLKNGFEMPVLGIWTWPMWGFRRKDPDNNDQRDIAAIQYAISKGLTCLDTAEMYAGGYAETLLWEAIKNTPREELFISSKVRWDNCSYEAIKNACKNSLERMGVDYIDLYYIHWRDDQFSLKDAMRAMNELVDEGYIRYIGVSNFSVESMKEAQKHSQYPIVANQVHYNIIYREPEVSGLLEYCQKNDVMLVAWRPLELGKLANSGSTFILDAVYKYWYKHSSVAIRWLLEQKNVVTLFKSSNHEHIDQCLTALEWKMSKEDVENIRNNFSHTINTSDAVPLA